MSNMTPREIVHELDKYIIGQASAKRAVAIALRNRWRRLQLDEALSAEISPKNILMIGPTGVGKTEIARRLAKLSTAPFVKVEASKFTEVGYVGRDVESIIRDLIEAAMKMLREDQRNQVKQRALDAAEERILDVLLTPARDQDAAASDQNNNNTRQVFRKKLREGKLNDKEIKVDISAPSVNVEIMAPPGMEQMTSQLQHIFSSISPEKVKTKTLSVKDALKQLTYEEATKLINEDDLKTKVIEIVEETGIVFIDELDKVAKRSEHGGTDISREGVQRDLLPLIEGCTVSTRYGMINTDHILFIASGAFHLSKPSDLIPELQGRLPIRVELDALNTADFVRILEEPNASLTEQYQALLGTEGVELSFTQDGINRIAEIAWEVNEQTENIGARRLHTVMERLLEDILFTSGDGHSDNHRVAIDVAYVDKHLANLAKDENLSQYIL